MWNWTHDLAESQADPPMVEPSRVAVDEKQIEVDGEEKWLYVAIDTESRFLLEIDVYSHRGTDSAALTRTECSFAYQKSKILRTAFLHRFTKKHDVSDTEFLIDGGGYLTALFWHDLSGQLDYEWQNHLKKWFQTVSVRIDRFHSFWRGSQSSSRRWLRRFRHHYNHDRPNQALDNQTPVEAVLN